jgi:ABC-type nitrate/sulfonate/bicarbonate transport system substrate-binding protein
VRKNLVAVVLLGLLVVVVAGIALKKKTAHVAPTALYESAPSSTASASASVAKAAPPTSAKPRESEPRKLDRALRVSALGWELVAPLLLENGALSSKAFAIDVTDETKAIENALARGGTDKGGADVAILPLPSFVLAYDRLRALAPVVFFVSGWSRGGEVLAGKEPLDRIPAQGDVVVRSGSDSALAFALFALELAGITPERVKLGESSDKPRLAALPREELKAGDQTDILLSTGDASRFVPFVVVAPASFAEKEAATLGVLVKTWLAGVKKLESDPTGSARTIAAMRGAPEPLALLGRLGNVAHTDLGQNAELLGLSGRGAVTIDALFSRNWRSFKSAKLSNARAIERSPVAPGVVAALVRSDPALAKPSTPPRTEGAPPKPKAQKALLVVRIGGDDEEVAKEIAFVLGAFPRSPAKLTVHRGAPFKSVLETLTDRYGLEADRLQPGKSPGRDRAAATLEIAPVP